MEASSSDERGNRVSDKEIETIESKLLDLATEGDRRLPGGMSICGSSVETGSAPDPLKADET